MVADLSEHFGLSLPAAQGGSVDVGSLRGRNGYLVVAFMSVNCPYALQYFDEMAALAREFPSFGFALLSSNTSTDEDDESLGAMAASYSTFPIPFLRDEAGELALALQASTTPEAIVIGPDNAVLYRGCIDDRFDHPSAYGPATETTGRWPWDGPGRLTTDGDHLRRVLRAITLRTAVTPMTTSPIGCAIYRGDQQQ